MTINKIWESPKAAVADIVDGASVAISGFGVAHRFPSSLIVALKELGARGLCIVSNSLGDGPFRAQALVENHQVNRMIVSFSARPGGRSAAEEQIEAGEIEVELVPQGTLVERLRAGGAGIPAFYTRTGVGTEIAQGKEVREFGGVSYILEHGLRVDYSFIRAYRADRFGNLQFRGASRNFNPAFAKGADVVIAEVDEVLNDGAIPPEDVGLPGIFVTRVVRQDTNVPAEGAKARPGREADRPRLYNDKPAWTRLQLAEVAAQLLPEPSYVNLGIGMPTLISNFLIGRDVVLHAENGVLSYGELASADDFDPDIYNAGSQFVNLQPGASFFDSVTSFEIARSGKLSYVVLGAYQVDEEANLANWSTPDMVGGGIGGAMDLVAGGAKVMILMEHTDSKGRAKLVKHCSYPLTGLCCVDVIVTDLCVLRRNDSRFTLERVAPGFGAKEVADLTEMEFDLTPIDG